MIFGFSHQDAHFLVEIRSCHAPVCRWKVSKRITFPTTLTPSVPRLRQSLPDASQPSMSRRKLDRDAATARNVLKIDEKLGRGRPHRRLGSLKIGARSHLRSGHGRHLHAVWHWKRGSSGSGPCCVPACPRTLAPGHDLSLDIRD